MKIENGVIIGVYTQSTFFQADSVIIATGGKSYSKTGSDGDGYKFAAACGHTVTALSPSLIPIKCEGNVCQRLQGLSLKNVSLRITDRKSSKVVYEDFGEMMFTHFGVTGPMILSASAHLKDVIPGKYLITIDLKPALDHVSLDARILSDFSKNINRNFENALNSLLPQKLIPVIIDFSGISHDKKVNSITKEERAALVGVLKLSQFIPAVSDRLKRQ